MRISEKKANKYIGVFFIILGLSVVIATPFQVMGFVSNGFAPGMIFIYIAIGFISLGLLLIYKTKKDNNYYELGNVKRTLVTFLFIIGYIIVMQFIGFIISSIIFLVLMMYYLESKNIFVNIIVSLLFVIIVYFLFSKMNVLLPPGIFF